MKKTIVLSLVALLMLIANTSLAATEAKTPSKVAEMYCALDYSGNRLSSATYEPVMRLMSWYETGDGAESGWDSFYIVTGYRVRHETIEEKRAVVEVEYDIIALEGPAELTILNLTALERIQMVLINGEWRIRWPVVLPRVSIDVAIRHTEEITSWKKSTKNQVDIEKYKDILVRLKQIRNDLVKESQQGKP